MDWSVSIIYNKTTYFNKPHKMEDGMGGNMAKKSLILAFNIKIETYSPPFFFFFFFFFKNPFFFFFFGKNPILILSLTLM